MTSQPFTLEEYQGSTSLLAEPDTVEAESTLPNQHYFEQMLIAQRSGQGALPKNLGLDETQFHLLLTRYFPVLPNQIATADLFYEHSAIREELIELRIDEWQEIVDLIIDHAKGADPSEHWLAQMIAAACMGSDHLWRAMGLADRQTLRQLIGDNFPALAAKNTQDMRWKKFFYRQLCEQGGHFICRSPTCDTCPTYDECFGEEL